jgi:hypothetical protein
LCVKDNDEEAHLSLARYFVFERGSHWLVTLDGAPLGRHAGRSAALNSAIVMADLMGAMRHDADVMIESEGQLEVAWTYGIDRLPAAAGAAA